MSLVKISEHFDVFIVGGGVNGCGVARDAVGRGLSVGLAEKGDLGGATSSGSTKLIHGGLRYLEHYEFGLVRKSLVEREVLWRIAPHVIYPRRFVLPHHRGFRPKWLLRLGLFIYDHLGGRRELPGSRSVSFDSDIVGEPLRPEFRAGFEYSDCWVDDARLVILNAKDAQARGAKILVRHEVISAEAENGKWRIRTRDINQQEQEFHARVLVNATGPWLASLSSAAIKGSQPREMRLIRGSHIVVPRCYAHDRSYILQQADGRIVFVIPFEETFTLIGTTDAEQAGPLEDVRISDDEVRYLCDAVNGYFKSPIVESDIVWSYSAVRPLLDDGRSDAKAITRDYQILTESDDARPPLISILGGKITTYRKLAEDVLDEVARFSEMSRRSWTALEPLPGGDFAHDQFDEEVKALKSDYPYLTDRHATRLTRLYGTLARKILGDAQSLDELGVLFGSNLYEAEVRYLIEHEWARTAEDILWRRTKEGLRFSARERQALEQYLIDRVQA